MPDKESLEKILGELYDSVGVGPDLEELIRKHPDLEEELRAHFDLLEMVDRGFDAERTQKSGSPERIGDYRIVREIGRGGMGVVYEAEQTSMGRRVALKVLSPSVTSAAQAIQRFEREARAAGKLHHQNIAPVYGMGRDRGLHYYAMELVEGQSLGEVITDLKAEADEAPNKRGPFGTTTQGRQHFVRLAEAMAGVAEALQAAHEEGVVHRDVKPTNLLLAPDGTLKLVDFGLARLVGEGASMTVTGQILGTPHYMSPEQAMARQVPIDFRTDIYSLGATLYEALTLSTPFTGDSLPAVCSAILHKEPSAPRRANPRIPQDLETIVLKAMEKDRERRYASAEEMAKDLRRFAVGVPIRARRIGAVGRAWRKVKRNKIRTGLVAAVVVLAAVGAYLAQRSASESAQLQEAEYERLIARAEDAMALETGYGWVESEMPTTETAAVLLSRAIEMIPDRADGYWLRALASGRTSRQRMDDIERALERGLSRGTAHMLRAYNFRRAGRDEEAEEERRLAASHEDRSPLGLYAKACLLAAEHRRQEAIEAATRVLAHPEVGKTVRAQALRVRANLRLKTEDWPGAHDDLTALKTLGDESIRTRVTIASLWRKLERADAGEDQFGEILREARSADDPAFWFHAARACYFVHEIAWFHRTVEEALARHADDPRIQEAQAWSLLKRGEFAGALEVANRLVESDPEDPASHGLRARAFGGLDRPEEALQAVSRQLELLESSKEAYCIRGRMLSDHLGRHGEALEAYRKAFEFDPADPTTSFCLGVALEHLGLIDQALEAHTRTTELEPRYTNAWTARWRLLLRSDRVEEADEEMKTVASREAPTAFTLHLRGHALAGLRKYEDALAAFAQAIRLESNAQASSFFDRDCLLLDRVRMMVQVRRSAVALQACEEALVSLDPSQGFPQTAWCIKSKLLSLAGKHDEALAAVDRVLDLRPHSVLARGQRAWVLQRMGKFQESLTLVRTGLESHPHIGYLWSLKGIALAELGEHEEATDAFRTSIRLDPTVPEAAWTLAQLARSTKPIAGFEKALGLSPESFHTLKTTARLNFDLRRYDKAFEFANRALKLDPEHTEMLNMRGTILCDQKRDYKGALKAFDHAISINDRDAHYHFNRGNALWGLGEMQKALDAFSRSLELRPSNPKALRSRGNCRFAAGHLENAVADLREAHELEPRSLGSLYDLVNCIRFLGRHGEAMSAAKKHASCDPRSAPPIKLAWLCAVAGDRERGLEVIRRMGPPSSLGDLYNLACVNALLGEVEPALEALKRVVETGYRYPPGAPNDPDFASLEQDPRYQALLEKLRGK